MMQSLKIFRVFALAAAALMVFSATVSATTLTAPAGTPMKVGAVLHAENENGHVKLANPIANIECSSTFEGVVTNAGGAKGSPVVAAVTTLDFTGCTNAWHVTTIFAGTLSFAWKAANEATVTSSGAKVEATRLTIKCVYDTKNTIFGTATDSVKTKATATIHINASIPLNLSESSGLCGTQSGLGVGSYVITKPDSIVIDEV